MSQSLEARRKRLAFRAWHRGMRELDLLIGGFADRHLAQLSEDQLDRFEDLLGVPEPLIYRWLVRREPPPAAYDHDVMALILKFRNSLELS